MDTKTTETKTETRPDRRDQGLRMLRECIAHAEKATVHAVDMFISGDQGECPLLCELIMSELRRVRLDLEDVERLLGDEATQ